MTIQRPPILVGPCFDAFVLNYAWLGASSPPPCSTGGPLFRTSTRMITRCEAIRSIACDDITGTNRRLKESCRPRDVPRCETRCGGEWAILRKRKSQGQGPHDRDQAHAGRRIERKRIKKAQGHCCPGLA